MYNVYSKDITPKKTNPYGAKLSEKLETNEIFAIRFKFSNFLYNYALYAMQIFINFSEMV